MILDSYKKCFNIIYIFSLSFFVDATWRPVQKYIEDEMNVKHSETDPCFVDAYSADALNNMIDTQHKIIDYMKKWDH